MSLREGGKKTLKKFISLKFNIKKMEKKNNLKKRPKTLTDSSPKICQWQIRLSKDAPHNMSSEKFKVKQ